MKQTIEDTIEGTLKDESAQTKAVTSLIEVKDKIKGSLGSDIELKTDLSIKDVCLHTAIDIMGHILSMEKKDFATAPILEKLTTLKERKSLSKERKSRREIVEVARNPDMQFMGQEQAGFVKRFLTSNKNRNIMK